MKADLMIGAQTDSVGNVSDNGWINSDLFVEYLSNFSEHTQPKVRKYYATNCRQPS